MTVRLVYEKDIRFESRKVVRTLTMEIANLFPAASIEEIGSTSIPGSLTKGDVDLAVFVKEMRFPEAKRMLDTVYEPNEVEHGACFSSYKGVRCGIDFGIQLCAYEAVNFRFVEFRDILRAHPELVTQYTAVKQDAAKLTMDEYRIKKNEFIESVLGLYD
jgi:GrpB-like predicted nucleotidyltransferase (UPF0157 family)